MSRRSMYTVLLVLVVLGAIGAGYIGWRYYTRDRVAVGTYTLNLPDEAILSDIVDAERTVMTSDEVLVPVIRDLGLQEHWGFDSETATLAHMREMLRLNPGREGDRMIVIYRDRDQEMALTILRTINAYYVQQKRPDGMAR